MSSVGAPSASGAGVLGLLPDPPVITLNMQIVPDPADARPAPQPPRSYIEYVGPEKPPPSPFDPYPKFIILLILSSG